MIGTSMDDLSSHISDGLPGVFGAADLFCRIRFSRTSCVGALKDGFCTGVELARTELRMMVFFAG